MKKYILFLLFTIFSLVQPLSAFAVENPLQKQNNIFGVHILFPVELESAAKLVNSSGGDWGYVLIPIQSGDKDITKWQDFMNRAKHLHLIPILRLATEGDYFNTSVWRKPTFTDILDFANFLDSLYWPTKNRYVIVYNEPNRGDEWGGKANPEEYAHILSYAVTAFKTKNPDFFIISSGFDNAAATSTTSFDQYEYITKMNQVVPGIFNQIDGLGSHSYPNPAFAQPPGTLTAQSISSFKFESDLIAKFTSKQLPVFITETGWSRGAVPENNIVTYFPLAFANVWNDSRIVTVIPFLLQAGGGPFEVFSLLKSDGSDTPVSSAIKHIVKVKGVPSVNPDVLAAESLLNQIASPLKKFTDLPDITNDHRFLTSIKTLAKYLLHM
ncbi:MAG: hypothetical protein E6H08_21940 [Bacteroidetes bacterium]|nr:MAG: hypothetical protein E6H08_21940 [Bacteroidota bacterium]